MKVRLPDSLKSKVEEAASASGRSLNAEIVFRLERSFPSLDQLIIEHRLIEMRQIEMDLLELNQQADELRLQLAQLRGPGAGDERRLLLERANKIDLQIRELRFHHEVLDSDISNVRDGTVRQMLRGD